MVEHDLLTLAEMLNQTAKWYPNSEVVSYDEEGRRIAQTNYKEFNNVCRKVAHAYHALGVTKGDRIALFWRGPDLDHLVAFFGAEKLGAIPSNLNFRLTTKMLTHQCDLIEPKIFVYDSTLEELALSVKEYKPKGVKRFLSVKELLEEASDKPAEEPLEPIREEDYAAIFFTSGTTGEPKPIVHSHRTLWFSSVGQIMTWDFTPETVHILTLHPAFIGWANFALGMLRVGGKLILMRRFDPKHYLKIAEKERATFAFLVPTMWRMLLQEKVEDYDLSSITTAAFAGEVMSSATIEEIKRRLGVKKLIYLYGATESGSHYGCLFITSTSKPNLEENPGSVGKPLWGVDVKIIKPGGTILDEVPPGEVGELIMRGPSIAVGIWNNPEKTAEVFKGSGRDKWWFSGDLAYIDEKGCIRIVGRVDFTFKSGGMKVHPELVERVIKQHPGVRDVAVIPIKDSIWGNVGKALVILKEGVKLTTDELDKWCKEHTDLPSYMRPRLWEFVEEFPTTTSGKLDRKKLLETFGSK